MASTYSSSALRPVVVSPPFSPSRAGGEPERDDVRYASPGTARAAASRVPPRASFARAASIERMNEASPRAGGRERQLSPTSAAENARLEARAAAEERVLSADMSYQWVSRGRRRMLASLGISDTADLTEVLADADYAAEMTRLRAMFSGAPGVVHVAPRVAPLIPRNWMIEYMAEAARRSKAMRIALTAPVGELSAA
ncbi:hypothetical protein EON67_07215, partial [archaeon]